MVFHFSDLIMQLFCCSLRENGAKIHWLVQKYKHLCINQIQLRFLHFNQHSITLWGIHYICVIQHTKEIKKYTFINANIKVINTMLKVNRDNRQTLNWKHYSLKFLWHCLQFNSIPGQPYIGWIRQTLMRLYNQLIDLQLNNTNSKKIGLNFYVTWSKEPHCTAPICVRWRLRLYIHHLDG